MLKKLGVLILMLISGFSVCNAQYTITRANMPTFYTVEVKAHDTLPAPGLNPGNSGTSQVWDLSMLNDHFEDSVVFLDPANTPYASKYPNSNLAARFNDTTYAYALLTNDFLAIIGQATPSQNMPMDPIDRVFQFPAGYNAAFNDTQKTFVRESFKKIVGSNLHFGGQTYDSVRVHYTKYGNNKVDGYGVLSTPVKIFSETMRMVRIGLNVPQAEYRDSATLQWAANANLTTAIGLDKTDTTIAVEWYSPDYRTSLAKLEFKGANFTFVDASYLKNLSKANGINMLTEKTIHLSLYPNPAANELCITSDKSEISLVRIYTMDGKVIEEISVNFMKQVKVNTVKYPCDNYICTVFDKNGKALSSEKFVVSK